MTRSGQAPDILSPDFARDPYATYRVLRDDYPLLWHEGTGSYLLSRHQDVQRAVREPVFSSDNYIWQAEPVHGRTILQMSGREHVVHRALVVPAFRGNSLRDRFMPMIERNARELVDGFRQTGSADLVHDFATHFPVNVIVEMLGLDKREHDRFHAWYSTFVAFAANLSRDPEVAAAGLRAHDELAAYLIPIIQERRAHPGDDLLSTLCEAEVDGTRMTDEEVKAFCSLLLTAGGETTDKAIGGMFRNLLARPEQFAAVRADRDLIPMALAETLRFTPPVHMIMRTPTEDVAIAGGTIPAGSVVTALLASANRDDRRFADPDTFDVFRTDLSATTAFSAAADHLSFALGRHFCVGALLARAEVEVGANLLLDALPELEPRDVELPPEQGVFTRGPAALPVRFTPTAP
ncbi:MULTISPECIES: cytochrome P450 [unclassified Kitasatospora]|uniref:cytochrome P450 n=1 Tax=unclassified Kitasatospora TaxID=2633591 RepID=UPI00070B7DDF|nr:MULTISPECIES: cytochrome P450 [unclassified Kitasatospora]KQV05710.1 cytochrome P450 [Kitasatospora sp. Root107]KRB62514.1 cytochrome P450 [Kitasatospora sp. Root187]